MKALSVRQPFAWAILHGGKDVENRVWQPPAWAIGQPLIIHASSHYAPEPDIAEVERLADVEPDPMRYWQRGGYIGRVTLTDAHRARTCDGDCSLWAHPQPKVLDPVGTADIWHWTLAEPIAFDTIIVGRGQLGLWEAPAGVEDGRHPGMASRDDAEQQAAEQDA